MPSPDQIFIFEGGGGGILGYSKLKVPSPDQIFIFEGGGGGGILGYSKLKVPFLCFVKPKGCNAQFRNLYASRK